MSCKLELEYTFPVDFFGIKIRERTGDGFALCDPSLSRSDTMC